MEKTLFPQPQSRQIFASKRTCQNCILMEPDEHQRPFCTPDYRKQHETIKPHCPRWDGGVAHC